jgi:type IV pilus assembly protein PilA
VSEGFALTDGAKTAVAEFYNNFGRFPASNASAGLSPAGSIQGSYVSQVEVNSSGQIVATYSDAAPQKANVKINTQTITLSPVSKGGSLAWNCLHSTGLSTKYLPSSCR